MNDDLDDLWADGDPFDDPAWQRTMEMAGAPPRPAKGYVVCSLAWLTKVAPILRSTDRLLVAQVLYSQCLRRRRQTVSLSNHELSKMEIGRDTKYRALEALQEAGAVSIKTRNGRSIDVTLHWFP